MLRNSLDPDPDSINIDLKLAGRQRSIFPGAATCVPLLPRPLRGQGGHLLVLGGHAAQAEGSARRPPAGQTVHAHHPRI